MQECRDESEIYDYQRFNFWITMNSLMASSGVRLTYLESFQRLSSRVSSCLYWLLVILEAVYLQHPGCLPFRRANRSFHGVGNWFVKFRTGKSCSGIAFTICTNQFHLPEHDREGLKLVRKEWNTDFCLEYFIRKNATPDAIVASSSTDQKPEDSGYEIVDDALISSLASFPQSVSTRAASCDTFTRF